MVFQIESDGPPVEPRRAGGGGIQKSNFQAKTVFKSQFSKGNGSKNEETAPRTRTGYPTQEPGVVLARSHPGKPIFLSFDGDENCYTNRSYQ